MATYSAEAKTENASRYLQQLCKHWSHKFEVTFDPQHGRIPFDADTVCLLDARQDRLDMCLEGADAERVAHLTGVVSDHLKRFAFREALEIEWHEDKPR